MARRRTAQALWEGLYRKRLNLKMAVMGPKRFPLFCGLLLSLFYSSGLLAQGEGNVEGPKKFNDPLANVLTDYGEINREVYTLTVPPEGIYLHSAGSIVADEIILRGPIVTNGFPLMIDTNRISVEGSAGKIVAFTQSAPAQSAKRNEHAAMVGLPGDGLDGINGKPGAEGIAGLPGAPGIDGQQEPGDITIYTAEIVGHLTIDANGQNGGEGGEGGQGGRGGAGAKGSNAVRHQRGGGRGGDGGLGGVGGVGGPGGKGGRPANVYLFGLGEEEKENISITQEGGQGGKGGVMGLYGLSGPGGKGGDGDSYRERVSTIETLWGVFHKYKTHTQPAGADGISPQRETNRPAGRGRDGLAYLGPRAEYKFAALSRLRQEHHKVEQALVNFHWERLFIHLLEYTAGQLTEDQILQTPVRQTTQWQDKISTEFFRHPQKVAAVWQDFFISPLQKMVASDELVLEGAADVRQVIHQAQQFTQLMGQISAQPASVQQIKKFVQAQKGSFAARLHDIFDACQKYLNLLAQEKIGFRYWQIPACHALGTTEPLAAARVALQLPLLLRDTQLAYLGAWQLGARPGEGQNLDLRKLTSVKEKIQAQDSFAPAAPVPENFPYRLVEKSTSSAEALAWDTFTTLLRGGQNHFAAQFKDEPTYPWGSKVAYLFPPSTHQTEVCGFYGIQQVDNTRLDLATRLTGLVMFKQVGPQEVANLAQEIRSVEE